MCCKAFKVFSKLRYSHYSQQPRPGTCPAGLGVKTLNTLPTASQIYNNREGARLTPHRTLGDTLRSEHDVVTRRKKRFSVRVDLGARQEGQTEGWTVVHRRKRNAHPTRLTLVRGQWILKEVLEYRSIISFGAFAGGFGRICQGKLKRVLSRDLSNSIVKISILGNRAKGSRRVHIIFESAEKAGKALKVILKEKVFQNTTRIGANYLNRTARKRSSPIVPAVKKHQLPAPIRCTNRFANLPINITDEHSSPNRNLRIVSLNCNGLLNSIPLLEVFCKTVDPDVIMVQETHVHEEYLPRMQGYCIIGSHLQDNESRGMEGQVHHGVGFLVKAKVAPICKQVGFECRDVSLMLIKKGSCNLNLRWFNTEEPVLLVSVYFPSSLVVSDWKIRLTNLSDKINKLQNKYSNLKVIIGGDWNCDLNKLLNLKSGYKSLYFKKFLNDVRLRLVGVVNVGDSRGDIWTWSAVRKGKIHKSMIDFMLVDQSYESVLGKAYTEVDVDSDHVPIEVSVEKVFWSSCGNENQANQGCRTQSTRSRWNTSKLRGPPEESGDFDDDGRPIMMTQKQKWAKILEDYMGDLAGKEPLDYNLWVETLANAADNYFGKPRMGKKGTRRYRPPAWMNDEVKDILKRRKNVWKNILELRRNSCGDSQELHRLWGCFTELRKDTRGVIKNAKAALMMKKMEELNNNYSSDSKLFWQALRTVTGGSRKGASINPIKNPLDGSLIYDHTQIMETWKDYFEELGKQTPLPDLIQSQQQEASQLLGEQNSPHEGDRFTEEDLRAAIKSLSDWKAPGDDGITNEVLKGLIGEESVGVTLRLLNGIQQNNNLPASWLNSIICPLPKTGDLTDPNNYRGVSLMSCVGKLYTRLLSMKLTEFMENKQLLCPEQIGFRQERRCVEHILVLREALRRRAHIGKSTLAVFIDFRKAYDTVPRTYLLEKMRQLNIPEDLVNNVEHYYHTSTGQVRIGDKISEKFNIGMGVKQGCSASPLLFSIFINDLLDEIKEKNLGINIPNVTELLSGLLYADDLVAMVDHSEQLQPLLDCITRWANRWGMSANAAKCAIVCFGTNHQEITEQLKQSIYIICGNPVPIATYYKYLGCIFQSDLTWTLEVKNRLDLGRKALFANKDIFRNRRLSPGIRLNLIKAIILPIILYGAEVWYENQVQIKDLEALYVSALRWATDANKLVPKAALFYESNAKPLWLTVTGRVAKLLVNWELMDLSFTSAIWIKKMNDPKGSCTKRKWNWRMYALQATSKIGIDVKAIIHSVSNKSLTDIVPPPYEQIKKGVNDYFKRWLIAKLGKCVSQKILFEELMLLDKVEKQTYLYVYDNHTRRAMFLTRTNSLPLNGRIAFSTGTKTCPNCENDNETLAHFLIDCPAYEADRRTWINLWMKYATEETKKVFVNGTPETKAQMLIWSHFEFDEAICTAKARRICIGSRLKSLKNMYLKRISHTPGGEAHRVCHINAHTDSE